MRYDHIAWDFNGTILDDAAVSMAITNRLLRERGLPEVPSLDEHFRHFGFPVEDYYVHLGFDFSKETYASVAADWMVEYKSLTPTIPLCAGVRELIEALAVAGIPQSVLSASEAGILRDQLAAHGLLSFFEEVVGREDAHACSKTEAVLSWRDRRKPGKALFIGDNAHDALCARAAGFDCVLICANAVGRERLQSCGCRVLSSAFELKMLLEQEGML
ncbi:MAG: HAD family hydrolase [Clostridia bacterium]|nr:HAD family hydrolase [Clostridia bacterium]